MIIISGIHLNLLYQRTVFVMVLKLQRIWQIISSEIKKINFFSDFKQRIEP